MLGRRLRSILPLVVAALAVAAPAQAAYPGGNGLIAFESEISGSFEIWTIRPDGTDLSRLTNCPTSDPAFGCAEPRWSPDGRRIAYEFLSPTDGLQIWVMNADGSGQHPIYDGPDAALNPTWSPDGTRIAFVRNDGGPGGYEIWSMRDDGSDLRQLTTSPGTDQHPAWSPDGSAIAFESVRSGNAEIWLMDPDGSNPRRITDHAAADFRPSWSPDGERILFVSDRHSGFGRSSIWVMDADGANPVELAYAPGDIDHFPAFSPDGSKIVYMHAPPGMPSGEEIWTMNADGSGKAPLTDNPGKTDENPDWQPVLTPPPPPPPSPRPPMEPTPPAPEPEPIVVPPTPVPPAAPTAGRLIVGRSAWVSRGSRRARLQIGCSATRSPATCHATLTLRAAGRDASAPREVTLPAGTVTRVSFTLRRRALRSLRASGRLVTRVRVGDRVHTVVLHRRGLGAAHRSA